MDSDIVCSFHWPSNIRVREKTKTGRERDEGFCGRFCGSQFKHPAPVLRGGTGRAPKRMFKEGWWANVK